MYSQPIKYIFMYYKMDCYVLYTWTQEKTGFRKMSMKVCSQPGRCGVPLFERHNYTNLKYILLKNQ